MLLPPAVVVVALLAGLALFLARPQPEQLVVERQPVLVDVAEVVMQDIRIQVRSQGTVTPRTRTTIAAEVPGKVVEVAPAFTAGGFFRNGDVLLRIDQRDYQAELRRAEAAVATARSQLALERGQAEVAYRDWQRFRREVERTPDAEALALRRPQLDAAEAELAAAQANLSFARDQLERTVIRAPYDGLVRQTHADLGQYLGAGEPLADIFALDRAEVRLPIPQNRLGYLRLPEPGNLLPDPPQVVLGSNLGDARFEWQGAIGRTEGVFDEQRRVLFVIAEVEDPYGLERPRLQPLRMGSFVDARIEGRLIPDLVVLPRQVLRAGNQVWVVDPQNQLVNRRVEILRTEGDTVYVSAGLESGERVSLSTPTGAVTGASVRVNRVVRSDSFEPPAPADRDAPTPPAERDSAADGGGEPT